MFAAKGGLSMSVRVRYAPSPTGHLHIGNARTALFNYLFARHHKGSFIVRIEDTDQKRNIDTGITSQMTYLKWLGLDWDESIDKDGGYGPYQQMARLPIYQQYANQLLDMGLVYKCYCTEEELADERQAQIDRGDDRLHYSRKCYGLPEQDKPYTLRFKVPENTTYEFIDMVKGTVSFHSQDVSDWVIMKKDGIPTYNFACAIDDYLMKITHVLRGEDHITNTPKQLMVFDAFTWEYPLYGHMTLIVNENNKKLSKRDESIIQFIEQYKTLGYLPEALFNFIALLGFSPKSEEELFSKEQFIDLFDTSRLSTSPAKFDRDKLTYINNRYIKMLNQETLVSLCKPFLLEANIGDNRDLMWFDSLITIFKDRLTHGKQIVSLYKEFFDRPFHLDQEGSDFLAQEGVLDLLKTFKTMVIQSETFNPDVIKQIIKDSGKTTGMKGKLLFMPIRLATTGSMHGPDLPQMLHLLDKDTVLKRLERCILDLS